MKNQDYAVIIAVYNSEKVIEAAINSALNLKPHPKQVIVVDDGSSDGTFSIIEELAKHNNKIFIYRLESNLGPSAARNYGISKSEHEICLIMDSDDESSSTRAAHHLQMHENGADISFVSSKKRYRSGHIFEAKNYKYENVNITPRKFLEVLLGLRSFNSDEMFYIPACTMSIKKSFFISINGFDQELRRNEDADLVIRAANNGAIFSFSDEICVTRYDSASIMKGGMIDVANEKLLMEKHSSAFTRKEIKYLETKLNFRALYFQPDFSSITKILNYSSLSFLVSNLPVFFRRVLHDLKKR